MPTTGIGSASVIHHDIINMATNKVRLASSEMAKGFVE